MKKKIEMRIRKWVKNSKEQNRLSTLNSTTAQYKIHNNKYVQHSYLINYNHKIREKMRRKKDE